jgi:hypothetical protein
VEVLLGRKFPSGHPLRRLYLMSCKFSAYCGTSAPSKHSSLVCERQICECRQLFFQAEVFFHAIAVTGTCRQSDGVSQPSSDI